MTNLRLKVLFTLIPVFGVLVCLRLFYWMVIRGPSLAIKAASQRDVSLILPARRGDILSSDNSPLVSSQETFLLFAYKPQISSPVPEIAEKLTPLIGIIDENTSTSAQISEYLSERLNLDRSWIVIKHYLDRDKKEAIANLKITGLGFESEQTRFYPEGSMSAQLLGFVGNDINGQPQGYFGLEGFYDRHLQGRSGKMLQETDASGKPILLGNYKFFSSQDGRTLKTTLNRAFQYKIENLLDEALVKYGAVSGNVVVLDSHSGAVLALASAPRYDPKKFYLFPQDQLKNPVVADLFEPGSVFKPLVMAAGIDSGAIKPDTVCEACAGPVNIGTFTIKTWNEQYHPNSTMTDVLVNSDNIGMVFAARRLGAEKFYDYLDKFGLGNLTGIDLQEETTGKLKPPRDWREIDLATISFGQGIALTPIQMVTAINTIANKGVRVSPYIVSSIVDQNEEIKTNVAAAKKVISEDTARAVTNMMVETVVSGEAKWAAPKGIKIAGKTGTAQIPIQGHYDDEKTIASFVGFAPAENPRFTMLVTLREPTSSPWGSETAAPLWFSIIKFLLLSH